MSITVSHNKIGKFNSIEINNSYIRVVILPQLGGCIWELEDLYRDRQWIWHRPGTPLQEANFNTIYDDVWAGGWEELFPNDAPGQFEQRNLSDHGEWWRMNWNVKIIENTNKIIIRLSAKSTIIKALCIKEICLVENSPELSINYSITSDEELPFHFLFKQHLALDISENCQLWIPGGSIKGVDPSFSTILPDGKTYNWPKVGDNDSVDLRIIPPKFSKEKEFVYLWNLSQSWCGIIDKHKKASIRMEYDSKKFPYVWLFMTYGGWRNLYTAVLEPCTNMPKDLSEAVKLNQSAKLEPSQEFNTKIKIVLSDLESQD